ncbi:hypothetical protein DL95DRAFT_468690 [Leptodontidium sp. 2 PMI_412]|nr:hypothetical protein DL95DRAFT_468690 [Leptodontidium sp. 2 PMI_412]
MARYLKMTSIGHNSSIYNPPAAFAQNISMDAPFIFYAEEPVIIKKRNKNTARRKPREVPSEEDWESKKSIIKRTWYEENHTTDELIKEMADFYNFHASKSKYQAHLRSWGLWKNETKENKGKEKYRSGDSQTRARRRYAQRRLKNFNSSKLRWAPNNTSVRMLLENEEGIAMHHSKMSHAIRCMVDSFFDLRRWTPDSAGIILAPPPRGVDTSKVWQTLIYQSYSAATLSRMQLFKKVNLCLERFANSVDQAAKHCDPNFLIYFWRVCISLNAVRLPGKLKREPFVLLRIFLKRLERSFSEYHGSHGIIDFLRSLNQVLEDEPPKQFRSTLNRTYQHAIDNLSNLLGDGHATVLGMRRHFSFKFTAKDASGRVCCEVDLATPYRSLLYEAELKYGQLGEQTISVLYDYASVMSPHTIDLEWVETLHERSARFCRDKNIKTCDLATRALVFSTELLANDHISKDRNRSLEIMEDTIEILKEGDQDCQVWAKSCSKTAIMRHKKKRHKQRLRGGNISLEMAGEHERLVVLRSRIEDSRVVEEQPPKGHVDRQRKKNRKVCEKFQSSVFSKLKP